MWPHLDLDLGRLIQQIQEPPVTRVGVLELESFYPAKERFALAMRFASAISWRSVSESGQAQMWAVFLGG